jgi:hypothetical protein
MSKIIEQTIKLLSFPLSGHVRVKEKWAQWVLGAGICWVGEKNNSFLVEILPKLRFYGSFTYSVIQLDDRLV